MSKINVPTGLPPEVERKLDVAIFEKYLEQLGVTLWADWDVTQPQRRRAAAEWFVDQMHQADEWAEGLPEDVAEDIAIEMVVELLKDREVMDFARAHGGPSPDVLEVIEATEHLDA